MQGQLWVVTLVTPLFQHARYALLPRPIVGVTLVTPLFQHARYALLPRPIVGVTLVTPLFQHARYALLPRPIVGVTLVTPLFQHAHYALLPSGCKANCGCDPSHSSIPACSLCTPALRVQGQLWV